MRVLNPGKIVELIEKLAVSGRNRMKATGIDWIGGLICG